MFIRADVRSPRPPYNSSLPPASICSSAIEVHRRAAPQRYNLTQSTCCPQCHHCAALPAHVRMPYPLVEAPAFFATFIGPRLAEAPLTATACPLLASARFNAQRLLVASLIAFLPAALSRPFLLDVSEAADAPSPLTLAHLALCAAAIFLRPAALILRACLGAADTTAAAVLSPLSSCFSSESCASIRCF